MTLEFVDSGDFMRLFEKGAPSTLLLDDVPDEMLLAVVSGQDRDLFWVVALKAHEHISGDHVLCLGQVLVEMSARLYFALRVVDVDELEGLVEARVR